MEGVLKIQKNRKKYKLVIFLHILNKYETNILFWHIFAIFEDAFREA